MSIQKLFKYVTISITGRYHFIWVDWFMPVIPNTQEEDGDFEARSGHEV
jgi:hypothetical protein